MTMHLSDLTQYLQETLLVGNFKDYCINGLQVEGTPQIHKIGTAVSANQETIREAARLGCDALLVHHGLFWGEGLFSLTGIQKKRVASLLENNINLLAYHLPLDMHLQLGNNVQLLTRIGATVGTPWEYGYTGTLIPQSHHDFQRHLEQYFQESTFKLIQNHDRPLENILIVTGGGSNYLEKIPNHMQIDLFISGEIKESVYDSAKERGISYLVLGHHQSEQLGVLALGKHIQDQFGLEHVHIDVWNPY